ncbi:hypothetical protein MIND_01327000 [Mycena indigotica]|uniref:F-box domain-containing protein n=1 Tax=Mycena indigotica TaxID=2126181 RepID=A0A8H6S1Z8_9AGAR|nr:uncharacterized protein MIND_01327000 [Mycena indigotica]KAF7290858.1 hypothetical protein MIND_01327000 [Mycena indigotica]
MCLLSHDDSSDLVICDHGYQEVLKMEGAHMDAFPDTIPEIDKRLHALHAEISALKTKRNTLVPIFRLPDELIRHIVELYAHSSDSLFNLAWTKLMWVCRRWAEIVFSLQELWGYIDLGTNVHKIYSKIDAQVKYSGVAPLTFKAYLLDTDYFVRWAVSENATRVRSLTLEGRTKHVSTLIAALPDLHLTALASLSVSHYAGEDAPGSTVVIPAELFDGRLPRLRELCFKESSSISAPWSLFRNLERLTLTGCTNSSSDSPATVDDVLQVLAASPNLKMLALQPKASLLPVVNREPITLPMLQYLYIRDYISPTTVLLNALRFPPTSIIQIYPHGIYTGNDIRNVLVPMRTHLRARAAPRLPFFTLRAFIGPNDRSDFVCTMELGDSESSSGRYYHTQLDEIDGTSTSLVLNSHPNSEPALRQIVTKFLNTARADVVTHLDASEVRDMGEASWRTILRLLPALNSLRVTLSAAPTFNARSFLGLCQALCKLEANSHIRVFNLQLYSFSLRGESNDFNGAWLVEPMTMLKAYVRHRRAQYDASPDTVTPPRIARHPRRSQSVAFADPSTANEEHLPAAPWNGCYQA